MLPLAFGIGGDTAGIFQVELDFLPWLAKLQWFGLAARILRDAA